MPATKGKQCLCHLCLRDDPKGRWIPYRQLQIHDRNIEQDLKARTGQNDGSSSVADDGTSVKSQTAQDDTSSSLADDVTSKIFTYTLTDNPSKHLFRRYTSHTEYPDTANTEPVTDDDPMLDTLDAVINAMGRLEIEPAKSSKLESLSKRERNILTSKTHASLSQIEKHIVRLLSVMDSESPSLEIISNVEQEFQTLRTTFLSLKRKTDSLEKRKIKVSKSFSTLESRIVACRSLHPATTSPVLYDTGEPSNYTHIIIY